MKLVIELKNGKKVRLGYWLKRIILNLMLYSFLGIYYTFVSMSELDGASSLVWWGSMITFAIIINFYNKIEEYINK